MKNEHETKELILQVNQRNLNNDEQPILIQNTRKIIIKKFAKTALPLISIGGIMAVESFIRSSLLSKHGITVLGADGLLGFTSSFIFSLDNGFLGPVCPMIAQSQNQEEIGNIVRHGWILGSGLSIPTMTLMYFAEDILNGLGQDRNITSILGPYARIFCLVTPISYWMIVNTAFLNARNRSIVLAGYYLFSAVIGSSLSLILIPKYGLMGAGYASITRGWIGIIALKLYFNRSEFRNYYLFNFRSFNFSYIKRILTFGSPISASSIIEQIRAFLIGMMMGWLGPIHLAINQASSAFLQFIIPANIGIIQASQICVSQFKGLKLYDHMRSSVKLSTIALASMNTIPAIVYSIWPIELANYFIGEEETADIHTMIRLAFITKAVSNIFEALQSTTSENLKGLLDTIYPSVVQMLTSLVIVLPLSYLTAFVFGWDLVGINTATCIGGALNFSIMLKRWCTMSQRIEDEEPLEEDSNQPDLQQEVIPALEGSNLPESHDQEDEEEESKTDLSAVPPDHALLSQYKTSVQTQPAIKELLKESDSSDAISTKSPNSP